MFSHRYWRASSSFTAFLDACFVGAFIASVVLLRAVGHTNCVSLSVPISITVGSHTAGSNSYHASASKNCTLLKVAWALGIANCILFAITAWAAWSLYRDYKYGVTVVHHKEHRRSGSSEYTRRHHHRHHTHGRSTYV